MRFSKYFMPTIKEAPADASIVSHQLMLRTGMVQQIASGIYAWLPIGLKVLKNISNIVREEQEKIDCIEILAPTIQPDCLWKKSGRYDDYGAEMLRINDRHNRGMLYGPTAEEVFTEIFRTHVKSYKDLPKRLYNIQWKFRDEIRPRFGVMRGREFVMKDAYSFDLTFEDAKKSYDDMFASYIKVFNRMGLKVIPVKADSGPIGGDLSHEFHILANTGESDLYYEKNIQSLIDNGVTDIESYNAFYATADGKYNESTCPVKKEDLIHSRGIEVGHIFYFGDKYSLSQEAFVINANGEKSFVKMGSYGVGLSRLVGAIIEAYHDDKGIIWPVSIAPFVVSILCLHNDVSTISEDLYIKLKNAGINVIFDDRDVSAGIKFSDNDLIGFPYQIIVGKNAINNNTVEVKERSTGIVNKIPINNIVEYILSII